VGQAQESYKRARGEPQVASFKLQATGDGWGVRCGTGCVGEALCAATEESRKLQATSSTGWLGDLWWEGRSAPRRKKAASLKFQVAREKLQVTSSKLQVASEKPQGMVGVFVAGGARWVGGALRAATLCS